MPNSQAGDELLDAWRTAEAEEVAARALRENAKSAGAQAFDGRLKFYQGRYQDALGAFEKALAVDSKDERHQAYKLLAQFTLDVVKNLKRFESAHFVLYLDEKRDGILAPYALEALEKSYQRDRRRIGLLPEGQSAR